MAALATCASIGSERCDLDVQARPLVKLQSVAQEGFDNQKDAGVVRKWTRKHGEKGYADGVTKALRHLPLSPRRRTYVRQYVLRSGA